MQGTLFSIEGPDGSGKSTLARSLVELLTELGYDVVHTRQPGGSARCTEIRELLLNREPGTEFSDMAMLALFYADRFQHLEEIVIPALAAGKVVVSDRSELSTFAYQVHAPDRYDLLEFFQNQHALVTRMLAPYTTRTFVCELTVEEAERRLASRAAANGEINFFDQKPRTFHERVHEGMRIGQAHLMPAYEFTQLNMMRTHDEVLEELRQFFTA